MPRQIASRLWLEQSFAISRKSIYQHILKDKAAGGNLASYLHCQKPRKKRYSSARERRGSIKGRVCIEQCLAVVDK